jgi:arylsulfatase A-like enzyme
VKPTSRWIAQAAPVANYLGKAGLGALLLAVCQWLSFVLSIQLRADAISALSFWLALFTGHWFWCVVLGGPALMIRKVAERLRVDGPLVIRVCIAAILSAIGFRLLEVWSAKFYLDEFPDRVAWAMGAARVVIVAVLVLGVEVTWRWLTPRVARLVPLLRLVFWCSVIGICYWFSAAGLAAIHLTPFIVPVALIAVCVSWWLVEGSAVVRPVVLRAIGLISLLLALLAPFTVFRNTFARSVAFAHCPLLSSLIAPLRDLADFDDDGSAPRWLGGDDCAEFDAKRGPLELEVPADGIDQDCRGGDPPVPAPDPARVTRDELLAQFGQCPAPPPNTSLLLLTVDALRADVISPGLAPSLVQFAAGSLDFTRAYSPSTTTRRALASVFGGKLVSDLKSSNVFRDDQLNMGVSWSEVFARAGYYTAGYNLLYTVEPVRKAFHQFNRKPPDDLQLEGSKYQIASATLTNAILDLFQKGIKAPFLIWAHYPDLHAPYHDSTQGVPPEIRGYERELAYTDLHLGRLLRTLGAGGVLDKAVVVISADHGEELGQRGIEGHGPFAFESVLHVPLLIRIPGCTPRRFEHPVSNVDLFENLAVVLGIKPTARSLAASGPLARGVVSEVLHAPYAFLRVVMDGEIKMIVDVRNGGRLLFDLHDDPMESRDLYRSRPDLAQRLEQRYQQWLDRPGAR